MGDEPGVADACGALGLQQVSEVERTEYGTPVLSGLIAAAEKEADRAWICLINADIMLTSGLEEALAEVSDRLENFLLIARRWNLDIDDRWSFETPGWEERLRSQALKRGVVEPRFGGVDLFAFPRGVWGNTPLPPFAVGRGRWDSAIIYQARARQLPVVDATDRVVNIHQNHDYSHHPQSAEGVFKGPESVRNDLLLGGPEFIFTPLNATHVLGHSGLVRHRVWNPLLLVRRLATAPASLPLLQPLSPVVVALAAVWRGSRRALNRARSLARKLRTQLRSQRSVLPLPVRVAARSIHSAEVPPGGGVEDFDKDAAQVLNRARLEHLDSLKLPIEGRRVLDVGSGPGHLAQFFVSRDCSVLCLEGRRENLVRMNELYPGLEGRVFDVETDDFDSLGRFDVVFSYGLLYHTENPWHVIHRLASVSDDLLILSTIVTDHALPLVLMEEETASFTQALRRVGCRPTPSFVTLALRSAGIPYVYGPAQAPHHPDFQIEWRNSMEFQRDGHPIRAMIVGSRRPLDNPYLVPLLTED